VAPNDIAHYKSGELYKFPSSGDERKQLFDQGGAFQIRDQVPLIAHFSLRHGFMESKFSLTAASESLTSETMPQWSLMTLSHEVMHYRVREIFQALFGTEWNAVSRDVLSEDCLREFTRWIESKSGSPENVKVGLRNTVLNFCHAIEQFANEVPEALDKPKDTAHKDLADAFLQHYKLAIEVVVHFHDFYFSYSCHWKLYLMSIWASWIKVSKERSEISAPALPNL
jgi:hypothetical protein